MVLPKTSPSPTLDPQLLERIRAATDTLELIAEDRSALAVLSEDEHRRLRAAAAVVSNPDVRARRTMAKALAKRRRRERTDRDDHVLAGTGIRALRRQPVFTTPNAFAPSHFLPRDIAPADEAATTAEPQYCYICKQQFSVIHHFYDRLCCSCGDVNFA